MLKEYVVFKWFLKEIIKWFLIIYILLFFIIVLVFIIKKVYAIVLII